MYIYGEVARPERYKYWLASGGVGVFATSARAKKRHQAHFPFWAGKAKKGQQEPANGLGEPLGTGLPKNASTLRMQYAFASFESTVLRDRLNRTSQPGAAIWASGGKRKADGRKSHGRTLGGAVSQSWWDQGLPRNPGFSRLYSQSLDPHRTSEGQQPSSSRLSFFSSACLC
jgi:hypothetical protein